jgi:predicted RNA binding protein YcfA (HicA-like mRNA interferase family)
MPKLPRDLSQEQATRAFVRSGGVVDTSRGKGSHRAILMPNGHLVILPMRIKVGLLASQIRDSAITVEEFVDNL